MLAKLPQPPGGWSKTDLYSPHVVVYLAAVARTANFPIGKYRELLTLAQILDSIMGGNLDLAADTLIQRFKSIELSMTTGWEAAQHLELIPDSVTTMATEAERRGAVETELAHIKATRALLSARNPKGFGKDRDRHRQQEQPQQQQQQQRDGKGNPQGRPPRGPRSDQWQIRAPSRSPTGDGR